MSINARIREVRQDAELNTVEFAERIGVTKSTTSRFEQEGYTITARNVQLICSNFHVAEEWLLQGTGPKYVSNEDMILQQLGKEFKLTPDHEVLIRQLLKLPPEVADAVADYTVQVAEALLAKRQEERKQQEEEQRRQEMERKHQEELQRLAADTKTPMVADSDRPPNLTDDEWELVKMARIEKTQNTDSSSLGTTDAKRA